MKAPPHLQPLADAVDIVLEGDRRFFERHPDRHHRLRLASTPEIELTEAVHNGRFALEPGERIFVAVRQVEPGARLRAFVINDADADTDVPEVVAQWVYDRWAPEGSPVAEIEFVLRNALKRRRAH